MHKKKRIGRREETTGKVNMSREGYAIIMENSNDDGIFIPASKMRGALHGDTVLVSVITKKSANKRREGEVIKVIDRSKKPFIGILQIVRDEAWVICESRFMPYDIKVSDDNIKEEMQGKKVAVIVDSWPKQSQEPIGHIIDVLGVPGENNTEMHAILTEFGLPYKFESKVIDEAEKISKSIESQEIKSRRDFRKTTTFTIDPADAKDFDDALSIKQLDSDLWEVGIHIADVSHYVKPGSLIDKEAYNRGTSVYLVDRTVPMLPEILSNNLCSLRPNEDKLCFSAVFELTDSGKVTGKWFGKTIINSDYRYSYEEAQQIIDTGEGHFSNELLKLNSIASRLREKRFKDGAINFERPDIKVEVDEKGKPLNIYQKVTIESNWLIEEFMLLANREVAYRVGAKGKNSKTFVYRIHEEPNIEKIKIFKTFIKHLGYKLGAAKSGKELSSQLNKLLLGLKDKPESGAVEIMALRTMARARYSTDNMGHYGLAFNYYTHFTSPIRRYPDLMVHRLLSFYLDKAKSQDKHYYEERCKYSSEREQLATDAERASIKYKMVEYMQDKVGLIFNGNISGVTDWGMFVEIEESKVEGLIPLREIKEDYLQYLEESLTLVGKRSGKKFTLGTSVKIKVERANLAQKQLDFSLIWEEEDTERPKPTKKRSSKK